MISFTGCHNEKCAQNAPMYTNVSHAYARSLSLFGTVGTIRASAARGQAIHKI